MAYVPILLYHQISAIPRAQDPFGLVVTPEQFAAQMALLARRGYTTVSVANVAQARRERRTLPPRTVAITFDDGYQDNHDHALPVLQAHNFTATIFLVTDVIGSHTDWYGQSDELAFPLMDWDAIKAMRDAGIHFGSHTCTHPQLDQISPDAARVEVCRSRQMITATLGVPCDVLSYPYEQFTPAVMQMVADCGYLAACGAPRLPESDYNLWRVEIGVGDTPTRFAVRISPAWRWFTGVKRHLRAVKRVLKR